MAALSAVDKTYEGRFTLRNIPSGFQTVRIFHPEYGSVSVEGIDVVAGITTDIGTVILSTGGTVEGRVLDDSGLPIPNATLVVEDRDAPLAEKGSMTHRLTTVVTDGDGYYQVSGLPSELCYICRWDPEKQLGVVRRSVVPSRGRTLRVDFGVGPVVTGVVAVDGRPLANERILLADSDNPNDYAFQCFARTDADGTFACHGIPTGYYSIYRSSPDRPGWWIKLATFDVFSADLDLGVIPAPRADLNVTLISDAPLRRDQWQVYVQEGNTLWSPTIQQAPVGGQDAGASYLLRGISPGTYQVVARKLDNGLLVRHPLTVLADDRQINIEIDIPTGRAAVQGAYVEAQDLSLLLFNRDKTLVVPVRDLQGGYYIDGLPAGDYYISNAYLAEAAPLTEFSLAEGDTYTYDIDTRNWISAGQGVLGVEVTSQDGLPLTDAQVWIEGGAGVIDPLLQEGSESVFVAPAGTYVLNVSHDGFTPETTEVEVDESNIIRSFLEHPTMVIRLKAE